MAKQKKSLSAGMTQAIGGALVAVDEQIFRAIPRVEERYKRRDEVSVTAGQGGPLVIDLPDDVGTEGANPSAPLGDSSRPTG